MATLPEEIVLCNILPWLPTKSLVRFLCVCKSWNSFIRNPSFLHLRRLTNHNNPTHHLLFLSPNPQAPVVGISQPHLFSTPFNPITAATPSLPTLVFTLPNLNFSETRVQCVNSLLCFHPSCRVWFSSHVNAFTLIANPTTGQLLTLPIDESIDKEFCVSTHFGYDPVGDEFKVLRLYKYRGSHEYKVFTIGRDTSWRVIAPEKPFALMDCLLSRHHSKRGLCVNGSIYWTYTSVFLVFHVGTEQLSAMRFPEGYSDLDANGWVLHYPDLVEIDSCLCLVGYCGSDLKLWILRDYEGQVWEEKSVLLPSEVVSQQGVVFPLCRVSTAKLWQIQSLINHIFVLKTPRGYVFYEPPLPSLVNYDTLTRRAVIIKKHKDIPKFRDVTTTHCLLEDVEHILDNN